MASDARPRVVVLVDGHQTLWTMPLKSIVILFRPTKRWFSLLKSAVSPAVNSHCAEFSAFLLSNEKKPISSLAPFKLNSDFDAFHIFLPFPYSLPPSLTRTRTPTRRPKHT